MYLGITPCQNNMPHGSLLQNVPKIGSPSLAEANTQGEPGCVKGAVTSKLEDGRTPHVQFNPNQSDILLGYRRPAIQEDMYKTCKLLRSHSAAKRRALCANAKSASAAAGIYVYVHVYHHVYISHMVYCHTVYEKICMYIPIFNNYTNVGARARVCVNRSSS